jgi:hypothetical protein
MSCKRLDRVLLDLEVLATLEVVALPPEKTPVGGKTNRKLKLTG